MQLQQFLNLFQGMLTPVIGMITVFIAYQQWKTNHQKLNLERYDRRLRIYEEVKKFLSLICRDAKIDDNSLFAFRAAVSEADFLFGPEIPQYIDEIFRHACDLTRWNNEYRDYKNIQFAPENYDHQKVCDESYKELVWLTNQFEPAKEMFRKYLFIGK